jgi:hypothetical protein
MAYVKSDFVAGDEIIFDDPMDNEQMGEFPSQWDLYKGTAEIASVNGKKSTIKPESMGEINRIVTLMKEQLHRRRPGEEQAGGICENLITNRRSALANYEGFSYHWLRPVSDS